MKPPGTRVFVSATLFEIKRFFSNLYPREPFEFETKESFLRVVSPPTDVGTAFIVTGMGNLAAQEGLENALEEFENIDAVVGLGFAGGLAKNVRAGDLVIPEKVMWQGRNEWPTPQLRTDLGALAHGNVWMKLVTSESLISTLPEKAALLAASGSEVVDMESAAWGSVCRAKGVSWAIVKSVWDAGDESIPRVFGQLTDEYGRVRPAASLIKCLFNPGEFLRAVKLGRRAHREACTYVPLLSKWLLGVRGEAARASA